MLDPHTLAQLSPPARLARLQHEAVAHYGTDRNKTDMARDFGYGRTTVNDWWQYPERIPAAVILCLAAWNNRRRDLTEISAVIWNRAADLKQLAENLNLPPRP